MMWPICPASTEGFFGSDRMLTCDRPEGHEMDGEQYHRDPLEGVEWLMTIEVAERES